jgi:DNA-binding MarR family transcriptional regulator
MIEAGGVLEFTTYNKKPSVCNCLNLRRASQAITQVYDEFLKPSGLSVNQFSLLKHIKVLEPVSVSDLALAIRLDRTTLVRNLRSLEEQGFIEDIAATGTRSRQLKLTERGLKLTLEAEAVWSEAQSSLENYLGKEEVATLTELLSKIEALVP